MADRVLRIDERSLLGIALGFLIALLAGFACSRADAPEWVFAPLIPATFGLPVALALRARQRSTDDTDVRQLAAVVAGAALALTVNVVVPLFAGVGYVLGGDLGFGLLGLLGLLAVFVLCGSTGLLWCHRLGSRPYATAAFAVLVAFVLNLLLAVVLAVGGVGGSDDGGTTSAAASTAGASLLVFAGCYGCICVGISLRDRRPVAATTLAGDTMDDDPAPGWQLDPDLAGMLRYWDGTAWTASRVVAMGHASEPPPGWCPDPRDTEVQRWWDGEQWTDHRRYAEDS